jgi:hypothetical protein
MDARQITMFSAGYENLQKFLQQRCCDAEKKAHTANGFCNVLTSRRQMLPFVSGRTDNY